MIQKKTICLLLIVFVFALSVKADYAYHFKPIHKEFDQIAMRLNKADFNNERQDINPLWLDQLDSIARGEKNQQLKARAMYWRVRSTQMSAQPSQCIPMLQKALKAIALTFPLSPCWASRLKQAAAPSGMTPQTARPSRAMRIPSASPKTEPLQLRMAKWLLPPWSEHRSRLILFRSDS